LVAAALSARVHAVVCRGARVDRVLAQLSGVQADVLLLVGARDKAHLGYNRSAYRLLPKSARLTVVRDAGHLLDDPEPLYQVVQHTEAWFTHALERSATRS
jgi:hypothetical protein